jgi:predicted RNA polymerase sigma factor
MKRAFVDTDYIASRKMSKDGNIDFQFWFDKSIEERLAAAASMIEVSFNTTNFTGQKVDRNIFSSFKRN